MTDKPEKEYRALSAEIDKVLSDKTRAATRDRMILRDAVCEYVTAERARGTTLKSLLQTLKAMLRKAEESAASATNATVRRDNELAQQLINWCTEFHRRTQPATT